MSDALEVLAEARRRKADSDIEGAIRLLERELSEFSGDLDE